MSNLVQVKVEELNALSPSEIVEDKNVENKFVEMYNAIWGTTMGGNIYHKEVFNFQKTLHDNPKLAECTKISLYGCFLDIAVGGLSLDNTSKALCYLIPRKIKTGYKDERGHDIYEKRANVHVTGYGELVMRMRAGQIRYADNPVVVYEGDTFAIALDNGKKSITYRAAIPRQSNKIIGSFIRIVRCDGSEDYKWLLQGDIDRLEKCSGKNNGYWGRDGERHDGKANPLYSSNGGGIDSGFLESKMIKHAFDTYPKVKTGKFTSMETLEEETPEIDYGMSGIDSNPSQEPEKKIEGFGPEPKPEPEPVKAEVSNADEDEGF